MLRILPCRVILRERSDGGISPRFRRIARLIRRRGISRFARNDGRAALARHSPLVTRNFMLRLNLEDLLVGQDEQVVRRGGAVRWACSCALLFHFLSQNKKPRFLGAT